MAKILRDLFAGAVNALPEGAKIYQQQQELGQNQQTIDLHKQTQLIPVARAKQELKQVGLNADALDFGGAQTITQNELTQLIDYAQSKNNPSNKMLNYQLGQEKTYDKRTSDLATAFDPNLASSRKVFGQNGLVVARAKRLEALLHLSDTQEGGLDRSQMEEVAIGLNALLSGANQNAIAQVQALVPRTLQGDAAKIAQWFANKPTGLEQKAFAERFKHTIEREREVAMEMAKETQKGLIPGYLDVRTHRPERFNAIMQGAGFNPQYINQQSGTYEEPIQPQTSTTPPKAGWKVIR